MEATYSPAKDAANKAKHRVSLGKASKFDFDSAKFAVDDSQNYGETRWIALGFIASTLYVLVFVETEDGIRAISLRKAKKSERNEYAED